MKSVTAIGPASSANFGSGFDCFAIALHDLHDTVTVTKNNKSGVVVKTLGMKTGIPKDPKKHTGGLVAINILKEFNLLGVKLTVKKGVPPGKGLGSSAATAAAVTVALNKFFSLNLSDEEKLRFAASGEVASAGINHADNVAGSLFGGFVVVNSLPNFNFISFPSPKNLLICIGIPKLKTPSKKTGLARKLIPKKVNFSDCIHNISYASMMVAGFSTGNKYLIGESMNDTIVEPARSHTIPNYDTLKRELLKIGALGVTISGAGPSVISILDSKKSFNDVKKCFQAQFKSVGYDSSIILTKIGKGARVIK